MTWPTEDQYLLDNVPLHDWGIRPATDGVIFHTTEGTGPTRADALATAKWQQSNPGSYNFIIYDGGVLNTILPRHACGGINPASDYWNPELWLKELLPARAWNNPTMYHLQIAFSGKAKALSAGDYPANMIDTAARLLHWTERRSWAADDLVVSAHKHWQDNRTDPGAGVVDRILDRYNEGIISPSSDDALLDCQADLIILQRRNKRLRSRLLSAEQKIEAVASIVGTDTAP